MADFDAQLPVRTIATEFTTEVANAAGTTINPAEDYAQGSTTSGQNGVLLQGAATTSAPSYTTGQTNPLSLDLSGNLRVIAATVALQAVNVTQWNSVALGSPSAYGTSPGAVNVIGANAFVTNTVATNLTQINGSAVVTAATGIQKVGISDSAGASITNGQKTSANSVPVVIAPDQSAIPVSITFGSGAVLTYFTDAAVATSATVTHSIAGPIILDHIHASGSGELKMNVATGTMGSETDKWVGFTSSATQNCEFDLEQGLTISTGQSVKVTLKNRDNQAQDLYLTFETH